MMTLRTEPEDELVEVGNALLTPPTEEEPLLELLGRAEVLLSNVEQSPHPAMLKVLGPVMKGLVVSELLRHPNTEVMVVLASCINEIIRITAPEAPYDDELMKVTFELIVKALEGLIEGPQLSQASYQRRLSILETVAKVRSCLVMLDLECDGLILEMFRHFFLSRRASHSESVFSLMETIMTLVLEESEYFSSDLILCLLESVKKDNMDSSQELGENVIRKCGTKLKPYLLKEIQSRGASLSDYSTIVTSVCQMSFDGSPKVEVEVGVDDATIGTYKPPGPVISNGVVPMTKVASSELASPSAHTGFTLHNDTEGTDTSIIGTSDKLGCLDGKADKVIHHSGKKQMNHNDKVSGRTTTEISDHFPMDMGEDIKASSIEAENFPNQNVSNKKLKIATRLDIEYGIELLQSKDPNDNVCPISETSRPKRCCPPGPQTSVKKAKNDFLTSPSTSKKGYGMDDNEPQTVKGGNGNMEIDDSPQTAKDGKASNLSVSNKKLKIATSLEGENGIELQQSKDSSYNVCPISETSHPKRVCPTGPQTSMKRANNVLTSSSLKKKSSDRDDNEPQTAKDGDRNMEIDDSPQTAKDGKALNSPTDKEPSGIEESKPSSSDILKTWEENAKDVEAKSINQSEKRNDRTSENESLVEPKTRKGRPCKPALLSEKHSIGKEVPMKAISSPDTAGKVNAKKDLGFSDEISAKLRRRKHADKEERDLRDLDEKLVGSSIQVWWPDDKKFYDGVVTSFDPDSRKHTILYNDGDVEVLLLKDERWETVNSGSLSQKEKCRKSGIFEADSCLNIPKKKAKVNSDSASKVKADKSVKRNSSTGKVKGVAKHSSEEKGSADDRDNEVGTPLIKNSAGKFVQKTKEKSGKKSKVETQEAGSNKRSRALNPSREAKDRTSKKAKDANPGTVGLARDATSPSTKSVKKTLTETGKESGGPKIRLKSKAGNTPKSGSKSVANGTSAKEKSSQKIKGTEDSPTVQEVSKRRGKSSKK